jgi:branched-chain amino acid transport system permease protein
VLGLSVTFGWTGLSQLGQAAFMGVGAYTSAVVSLRAGLGFWSAMPVAVLTSAILAALVALPLLRLRGHYLAIATIGLNVTAEVIFRNWTKVTGGYDGLVGIPSISLFGYVLRGDRAYYGLILGFVVLAGAFLASLRQTRYGRSMIAVRDDELAAGVAGIYVRQIKIQALVIGSVLAGVSGALYAHFSRYLAPQDFELSRSITFLVMLIVGGETSVIGSVLGAVGLTFAPEWLRFIGDAYLACFGIGVLLVLILMPDGVVGRLKSLAARKSGRRVIDV